jgi:L-fuculose-phosphate aldolase
MNREARETVLEACRLLADRGFLPGTGGNVSVRATREIVAITPSACDYYTMTADDICLVELTSGRQVFGDRKPSVELGIHTRLLKYREDFEASIHTHQPVASAITLLGKSLPIDSPDDRMFLGTMAPLVGYAPSGTSFLARAFGKALRRDASAYLLKNHGIVCGGRSMSEAIENVGRLERVAKSYLSKWISSQAAGTLRDRVLQMFAQEKQLASR